MSTLTGAQGSQRRALRAAQFCSIALLGALALGLAGSARPSTGSIALSGFGTSGPTSAPSTDRPPVPAPPTLSASFTIAGSVEGLFPGAKRSLVLTVTNSEALPIVVTSLATDVHNASATCTGAYLSVSAFSGQLSVPAHGSAKTTVTASMVTTAPNSCRGATFPLIYSGVGKTA
jgi:hypothetical protein